MDTSNWSTEVVAEYLETLGLGSYQSVFIENDINGEALPLLNEGHLKEIGMKSVGHRITLLQWLEKIKKPSKSNVSNQIKQAKQQAKLRAEFTTQPTAYNEEPKAANSDQEEDSDTGKGWQQKRRAAMMKRLQNGEETSKPKHIMQPEMNFGNPEDSKGVFGAPPPIKGKKQSNYGNDDDDEDYEKPLKFDPNPFSREDDDMNPPKPLPRTTKRTQQKKPAPAPAPAPVQQRRKPVHQDPEPEPEDDYEPPPKKADYDIDFDQFGEDDVPPMGGSKLGGGFPGNAAASKSRPAYQDDDEDDYQPPKRSQVQSNRRQPPPQASPDPNDDRVECSICHRRFAADRIEAHERACQAAASRKKKVFDSSKMRVQGTEAAQFQGATKEEPKKKKVDFRAQHEALVANMRAARQYQKYEEDKAKGKNVGPPPSMPAYEIPDDDRQECPYCGRKFGSEAFERHVKFCETKNAGKMRTAKQPVKRGRR